MPWRLQHAAHAARADLGAGQTQLIGDALRAVRREGQGVVEDLLLDLGRDPVRVRMPRSALLLDEGGHAADLEGPAHLVEGVAVVAHDLAGLRHVAELLGRLQQGQLPLGTLRQRGHLGSPDS